MRTRILLLIVLCLTGCGAFAQSNAVKYADAKYSQFDFNGALALYLTNYPKDSNNQYLIKKIADSYRLLNKPDKSEYYYSKLAQQGGDKANTLYYAEALRSNKKYDKALQMYQAYLTLVGGADSSVEERITGIHQLQMLNTDRGYYKVTNAPFNSANSDFGAVYYANNQIMFASNRPRQQAVKKEDSWSGKPFLALYTSTTDGKTEVFKLRGTGAGLHCGPASFSAPQQELYLTLSNTSTDADGTTRLKLYRIKTDAEGKPTDSLSEAVLFNDNSYSVMHPAVSADGNTLFFASDMPGTGAHGGTDIYMTNRSASGIWQQPVNLGVGINTNGDDMFPFISADSVLYFSSNGHAGLGGLDIYRSVLLPSGVWTQPQNLGFPVNTNFDDFAYSIDTGSHYGYISSNRTGGQGDDDIYAIENNETIIAGQVVDATTDMPLNNASVLLTTGGKDAGFVSTDDNGSFIFSANRGGTYMLAVSKAGYKPATETLQANRQKLFVKIKLGNPQPMLAIHVKDSANKAPIANATGYITEVKSGKQTPFTTDAKGNAYVSVRAGTDYLLDVKTTVVSSRSYSLPASAAVTTQRAKDTTYTEVALIHNVVNELVDLHNIYFELDKAFITEPAKTELNKIVKLMGDNPAWQIEVAAFTDCRAPDDYNLDLSRRRAASTVDYLVVRGVARWRLISAGYGEQFPVLSCECSNPAGEPCSEEDHALNRRVEFSILKFLTVTSNNPIEKE